MEIRLLRYFLAVAREENITKAAEILHISQPSLSVQLKELEKEVGKKLLIRGKRKITLTKEGILLRQRAEEILSLVEKTQRELVNEDENISGEISIGSGETEAMSKVLNAAICVSKQYPNIHYHLFSGDAEAVMEQLDNGLLDFGILIEPVDLTKYERIHLNATDTWGLLMQADHPLSKNEFIEPKDLWNIPIITPKRRGLQDEIESWMKKDIENLNVAATYNLIYHAILLVEKGFGAAVVFEKLIQGERRTDLTFRPFSPRIGVTLSLVWKKYHVFSKAAEKFLEEINNQVLLKK